MRCAERNVIFKQGDEYSLEVVSVPYWLRMDSMNLTGTLPQELEALSDVARMDFQSNPGLTGTLPAYDTMKDLKYLYVRECNLSGDIEVPLSTLGNMSLTRFYANDNQFTGKLPADVGAGMFKNLTNINVENNLLSGTIPTGVFALTGKVP